MTPKNTRYKVGENIVWDRTKVNVSDLPGEYGTILEIRAQHYADSSCTFHNYVVQWSLNSWGPYSYDVSTVDELAWWNVIRVFEREELHETIGYDS